MHLISPAIGSDGWVKSSYSGAEHSECVEAALLAGFNRCAGLQATGRKHNLVQGCCLARILGQAAQRLGLGTPRCAELPLRLHPSVVPADGRNVSAVGQRKYVMQAGRPLISTVTRWEWARQSAVSMTSSCSSKGQPSTATRCTPLGW